MDLNEKNRSAFIYNSGKDPQTCFNTFLLVNEALQARSSLFDEVLLVDTVVASEGQLPLQGLAGQWGHHNLDPSFRQIQVKPNVDNDLRTEKQDLRH